MDINLFNMLKNIKIKCKKCDIGFEGTIGELRSHFVEKCPNIVDRESSVPNVKTCEECDFLLL